MLLVILGAGASYDSVASLLPTDMVGLNVEAGHWRPPLANDLFGKRKNFAEHLAAYPQLAVGLGQRLRFPRGEDLESVLDTVSTEAKTNADRWPQLAAIRFYLRRILWQCSDQWWRAHGTVTNYGSLVDGIRNWQAARPDEKVCFVSFNYDLLIERTCNALLRRDYTLMRSYLSDDCSIIKPHGSVNWVQHVSRLRPNALTEAQLIESFAKLDLDPEITTHSDPNAIGVPYDEVGMLVPALTIPLKSKSEFLCPPTHLAVLRTAVQTATRLIVIGWKGPDERFKELWKLARQGQTAPLSACIVDSDNSRATRVASGIRADLPGIADSPTCTGGFSAFVTGGALEMFLSKHEP